jgi:hypothetical protein
MSLFGILLSSMRSLEMFIPFTKPTNDLFAVKGVGFGTDTSSWTKILVLLILLKFQLKGMPKFICNVPGLNLKLFNLS